jgi:hypothetical protein
VYSFDAYHARGAHGHSDRAEVLLGLVERGFHRRAGRHVRAVSRTPAAARVDQLGGLLGPVLGDVEQGHLRAFGGELPGTRPADAARGPADDHGPPVETPHYLTSLSVRRRSYRPRHSASAALTVSSGWPT